MFFHPYYSQQTKTNKEQVSDLNEKTINRYLAGECSDVEMEQIAEWLNTSESNRKEWLKLRMVSAKSHFTYFSNPEHIDRSYKELMEKQRVKIIIEKKITRKISLRLLRYAASFLVLIGLSFFCYKYITDWQNPKMIVVVTGEKEHIRQLILEDSSNVWLSAGSRIEYPERFGKKDRKVSVEGKVYFDVAKDENRPFLVKTEAYTVKVLGTSFEVNAFKYNQISDVTLIDGNVEILDNNLSALCTLQPGQQFEIDKISNCFNLHPVQAEMYASWHVGTLEFDGLTFAEIVQILERQYNVRIIIDNNMAKDQRLVGSLSFQKDIYQMMRTIELVIPIRYHVQTDTVVYSRETNQ